MTRALIYCGAVLILLSLVNVISPRLAWGLQMFGRRWEYAEPNRLEPSQAFLSYARGAGLLMLVVGVALVAGGVWSANHPKMADRTSGTVGGLAVQLDRAVRHLAATTHGNPRDKALADKAITQVRRDVAVTRCRKRADTTSPTPSPGPSASPGPGIVPFEGCLSAEEAALADRTTLADDYPRTGHITVEPDFEMGLDAERVCLTVASNRATPGKVTVGDCPTR